MTDECEHITTITYKIHNDLVECSLCLSCGKLRAKTGFGTVETYIYETDEIREVLIDKIGEWVATELER
jgi:hypothetical protein